MTKRKQTDLPDLLTGGGACCGPDCCFAIVTAEATSQRGQAFLAAYFQAIDGKCGGDFVDDEPEVLMLTPEQARQFKRQASLAAVSMGELKDFPDYDSFA